MDPLLKKVQQALIARGYGLGPSGADGIPGRYTTNAVEKFQRDANLDIRYPGTIGPKTLAALNITPPQEEAEVGATVIPPWVTIAKGLLGKHEVTDAKKLDKLLGLDTSAIPWCGAFEAYCIATALPKEPIPTNPLWALNWLKFGDRLNNDDVILGAIAAFKRPGGGHVGNVVGHDETALHILGGNQSNKVSVARVAKKQLQGLRWPKTYPLTIKVLPMTSISGSIEHNLA